MEYYKIYNNAVGLAVDRKMSCFQFVFRIYCYVFLLFMILGLAIQRYLSFATCARLYFNSLQLIFFYKGTFEILNCKTFTMLSKRIMWKYFDKVESSVTRFTYF